MKATPCRHRSVHIFSSSKLATYGSKDPGKTSSTRLRRRFSLRDIVLPKNLTEMCVLDKIPSRLGIAEPGEIARSLDRRRFSFREQKIARRTPPNSPRSPFLREVGPVNRARAPAMPPPKQKGRQVPHVGGSGKEAQPTLPFDDHDPWATAHVSKVNRGAGSQNPPQHPRSRPVASASNKVSKQAPPRLKFRRYEAVAPGGWTTVWFESCSPEPIPLPRCSAAMSAGDIYIHFHHGGHQIWIKDVDGRWLIGKQGQVHPEDPSHTLHIRASGEPIWI